MGILESGLYTHLTEDVAIARLIDGRMYPLLAPQGATYPLITYTRISGERLQVMGGISGVEHPRIQIDCWAENYEEVKELADAVRRRLDSYQGPMGDEQTLMTINEGDNDDVERDPKTGQDFFRVRFDFEIWHQETKQ